MIPEEKKKAPVDAAEEKATVEAVEHLGCGFVLLEIRSPLIAARAQPGQFVMARADRSLDPLLRRPLGILRTKPPSLWLYFQVKGRGTARLAALNPSMEVDLLGPLGKPFPLFTGKKILLLAGGRGIVPLFFYAERHGRANTITLAYGGRCRDEIHLLEAIKSLPLHQILLYSEDGSVGRCGLVTAELEQLVDDEEVQITISCGPEGMLKAAHHLLGSRKITHYVSLEARMGCGFGICHSCAIPASDGGYLLVCQEGPLFGTEEIRWQT